VRLTPALLPMVLGLVWAGCASSLVAEAQRRGGDPVTEWTLIADYYGNGHANWRTMAILQMAMHDALNAADPVYGRWSAVSAAEAETAGANPEVAMAAAAHEVLQLLHPEHATETSAALAAVLARWPDGPSKSAGRKLGSAIGKAAVESRRDDGFARVRYFAGEDSPARWRPTPEDFATSRTNSSRPFLFDSVQGVSTVPPPGIDTPAFAEERAATRSIGGSRSKVRSAKQTADAEFWAHQSGQRGFVGLAIALFAAHRPSGGLHEEARVLSQLTMALADSAILTWSEKSQYSYWRPITAIRAAGDPTWELSSLPHPSPSTRPATRPIASWALEYSKPRFPIRETPSSIAPPRIFQRSVATRQTFSRLATEWVSMRNPCRAMFPAEASVAFRRSGRRPRTAPPRGSGQAHTSRPLRSSPSGWLTSSSRRL
jgi:hypothetical protein